MSHTIKELKTPRLNKVLGRLIDFSNKYTDMGHPNKDCPIRKGIAVKNIYNETIGNVNLEIMAFSPCSCKQYGIFWQLGQFSARIAYQILYNKDLLPHTLTAILAYLKERKGFNKWNTGYLIPIVELIDLLEIIQEGIEYV